MPAVTSVVPGPSKKSTSTVVPFDPRTASNASQDHNSDSLQIVPNEAPSPASWYSPTKVDIFFLGITIVMCGQYMSWNIGLAAGVYTYLIIYVIMGAAYIAFCCCMAELTSALPFAGGSYGLARCTLGFFPAFLIGSAEALEYTASVAIQAICVCDIVIALGPSLLPYKPLVWLVVFFIPTTAIQIIGGAPFWIVSTALGAFQTALLVIYCLGLLGEVNFSVNALRDPEMLFAGGLEKAMHVFPFSAWFFLGVEALNLASNEVAHPKTQIPHGQIACIVALYVTGIAMYLTVVSLPTEGGIAAINGFLAPLNDGFIRLFNVDPAYVTLLSLPAQYAGGYGFCWASSMLISSMGRSRLLPPWLGATSTRFGTPHWAIILVSVVAYVVCVIVHYEPSMTGFILPVCLLFAFMSYSGQCIGYILLTRRYPIKSQCAFKNPFGLVGAVYSLVVWVVGIIAIVGFQGNHGVEVLFFAVVAVALGVYYRMVARQRQTICEDESKVLLVAHIAFFNKRKKQSRNTRRSQKSSSVGPSLRTHTVRSKGVVESFHASQVESQGHAPGADV